MEFCATKPSARLRSSRYHEPRLGRKAALGPHVIRGVAWSGGKDVTSVRVSTNAAPPGDSRDCSSRTPYSWRLWELPWRPAAAGSYTLMARATDTGGAAQPFAYDFDLNGYEVNHVQPVKVDVSG